jgi:hypothetical protein
LLVATLTLGGLVATAAPASAHKVEYCAAPDVRPTLQLGSTSHCVAALQHFLKSLAWISGESRYDPGPIDSIFGRRTQDAVTFFQAAKKWQYTAEGGLLAALARSIETNGVVQGITWYVIAMECGQLPDAVCRVQVPH